MPKVTDCIVPEGQIEEWLNVSQTLKKLRASEMYLRKAISSAISNHAIGQFKAQTEHFNVSVKQGLNIALKDTDRLEEIYDSLTEEEKACINYKPSLVLSNYNKLPRDSILHSVITSTAAAPVLTIKEK